MTTRSALPIAALLCLGAAIATAQSGTLTTYTTTWNNFTRSYLVYVPPTLGSNPPMVVCLHGTQTGTQAAALATAAAGCTAGMAWNQALADPNGILMVYPIATWKPAANGVTGYAFWESYNTATYFPAAPDDSGFIRSLILQMEQPVAASTASVPAFNVNPGRVFVTGQSSGGMMTERVGIDSADLVAAIAPILPTLWVGNGANIPNPVQAISVLEIHGDVDQTVLYCGGGFYGWGEHNVPTAGADVDVNFWLAADGFAPNPTPLCSGTTTTSVSSLDFRNGNGVEVEFLRMRGVGHIYKGWISGAAWEFFATHGRTQ
jgi:poly(3-hydroxybutyrate) depolymerase